jgi:hypothetical protein
LCSTTTNQQTQTPCSPTSDTIREEEEDNDDDDDDYDEAGKILKAIKEL